jgi:hypothetical protein
MRQNSFISAFQFYNFIMGRLANIEISNFIYVNNINVIS